MGWKFDGLQFAMRESSKRPSMAFVFFTRPGLEALTLDDEPTVSARGRPLDSAQGQLRRLADDGSRRAPAVSARERLAALAGDHE